MLPERRTPDFWADSMEWISDWIHVSRPTQPALFPNIVGEVLICHKSVHRPQSRIYVWYPIQRNASAPEEQTFDAFLDVYAKDKPLPGILNMTAWLPSNPWFQVYGNQLFKSNQPIYIQSDVQWNQVVWAKPTALFCIAANQVPVRYKGMSAVPKGPDDPPTIQNRCGMEGIKLKSFRKRQLKKLEEKKKREKNASSNKREDRVPNSAIMDRLGSIAENLKNMSYVITYGASETSNTLDTTGEQVKQTADGVRQTSMDVQTTKAKIQEVDAKVNEIHTIVKDLTDGNKIMVNADGSFSKITDVIRPTNPVGTTTPATTTTGTTVPSTTVPSTTVPSTTVPSTTVPSTTVPSTTVPSTTVPSPTVPATTTATPGTAIPVPVPTATTTTAPVEGFEETMECHEEGQDEDVEMYNIEVGSAFASSLSKNASIRMGGAIMFLGTIIITCIMVIPTIITKLAAYLKTQVESQTDENASAHASGAVLLLELITCVGLMAIGLVSIGSNRSSELAGIFSTLSVAVVVLAFTFFVATPRNNNVPNYKMNPFIKIPQNNTVKFISYAGFGITAIGLLIGIILSLIPGGETQTAGSIVKWAFFIGFMSVLYMTIGHNIIKFRLTDA
jgi:uncharacterized membrane protein